MPVAKHARPSVADEPLPAKAAVRKDNGRAPADATEVLKILADPTRLGLIEKLLDGERCVAALTDAMGLRQPRISHHLGILRRAGLVQNRRAGKKVFYRLSRRWLLDSPRPRLDLGSFHLEFSPVL